MCHSRYVTLFRLELRPGQPIFDQVVYAAKKAIVSGALPVGQTFPSVRALAADLKVHPNTAHKAVQYLIQEGFLKVRPGLGTVVAEVPVRRSERRHVLDQEVEELVIEAKRVGLELSEVIGAVESQWVKLDKFSEVTRK